MRSRESWGSETRAARRLTSSARRESWRAWCRNAKLATGKIGYEGCSYDGSINLEGSAHSQAGLSLPARVGASAREWRAGPPTSRTLSTLPGRVGHAAGL